MTRRKIKDPLEVIVIDTYEGFVPTDKPWHKETLDAGKDRNLLRQLQELTGNGLIEVTAPINEIGDRFVVNEEGLLLHLPVNQFATFFAQVILLPGFYIAGPAVIVGPYDSAGNFTAPKGSWELVLERMWRHVTANT